MDIKGKTAFEHARGISKAILKKDCMVLRYKPANANAMLRPNERHTISVRREITGQHFNWLCEAAAAKVIRDATGPPVTKASKPYVSQIRQFLRKHFELRKDEIDPVETEDGHYKINLEVFLCSRSYLNV